MSVSFVSASVGFALTEHPCPAEQTCLGLLRTTDAGHTWASINPPATHPALATPGGVHGLRFADADNGWAYGPDLWATHDGGQRWVQQSLPSPATGGSVDDVEVAAGVAHAAVIAAPADVVEVLDSGVGSDRWTPQIGIPLGAGPVPRAQVVVQGQSAWVIEVDRTVVWGARRIGGHWSQWQPPCATSGGFATLAAADELRLVAVCDEGQWGMAPPGVHLLVSTDGGVSFRRLAAPLPMQQAAAVAETSDGSIVVSGDRGLMLSIDGGTTWAVVAQRSAVAGELGFTTATQGIAVVGTDSGGQPGAQLLMTRDAGRHWTPVLGV